MFQLESTMDLYSDYLISQHGYATATSLSQMLDGKVSHDKITRFLANNQFGSKQLWQTVKPIIIQRQESEAVLAIDDTIIEKPYSKDNDIICWHYSHAKGRTVKGIELITAAAIYDNMTLPICYELIDKTSCYEDENNKIKRRSVDTKNQRFRRLIDQAIDCNLQFNYVLSDNWFGAKSNLNHIHYQSQKKFIIGIKSNRLAAPCDKTYKLTRVDELAIESGTTITVCLKGLDFAVKLLKQVFTNEDGSSGTLYLITNDLDILACKILEIYKKRWKIEEFHKSVKCNGSAAKSPTKTPLTQANHLFASIIAFCKLESFKIANALNHFAIRAKLTLAANKAAFLALAQLKPIKLNY
jgi:hypothetical protein